MGHRRKKGGMAALGNSMSTHDRRHKQSAMMRVSGFSRRRGKKDTGLTGWFTRGFGGKRKKGGMVSQAASSFREHMSPTEKAEVANDAEETLHNEQDHRDDNAFVSFLRSTIARMRGR